MVLGEQGDHPTRIELTESERAKLIGWARSQTTEQRLVPRARVVLASADGLGTREIAQRLGARPATVSKWRTRFAALRISGWMDKPGRGRRRRCDRTTEKRILAQIDKRPPSGYATWIGSLVARALGDVSADHVWAVLRKHGIQLQRRRSWCISTDLEFAPKAADVVALYLDPPKNAVVISVDEKPPIQALERAQGSLRLPNGRALMGFSHEYKRHGTTTRFAAFGGHDRARPGRALPASPPGGLPGLHEPRDRG